MGEFRRAALLLALLTIGCTPLQGLAGRGDATERLAAGVSIARDEWGVPHIIGDTDAHTAFGAGYAQAEDGYVLMEESYLHALGRASHWYGEQFLASDLVKAALQVERLAREEYEREPAERRAIWDAFAAGVNYYIRTAGVQPRLITRFEPWMPFALVRTTRDATIVDGVRLDTILSAVGAAVDHREHRTDGQAAGRASAVSPARTGSGHALLLQSSSGGFFGPMYDYEMSLTSGDGWHIRGFAVLGTPVPRSGHNERIAWAHAASTADAADLYEVTFDHPSDPLMYRFDDEWRRAAEWVDTLLVNSAGGVQPLAFTFRRTHHGPVVAASGSRMLALRVARMDEGGSLQQWYAMGRAGDLASFRSALDARAIPVSTVYADTGGNILYVHAGAVPVRDTAIDWTKPVDGSSSRTEWNGYHALAELPQVLNPANGRIDAPLAPAGEAYPRYMSAGRTPAVPHAALPRTGADSAWTFAAWSAAAFDTHMPTADVEIAALAAEWEQIGGADPARARRLDEIVDLLRSWDGVARVDSEETTFFVLWQEQLRSAGFTGGQARFRALEDVVARLELDWDSVRVPWGDVNRLQRIDPAAAVFSDEAHSVPVAGVPGWTGVVFAVTARTTTERRRRYGESGVTAVMAVELAPAIRSASVVTFGQSADTASAHFLDQAALYARGELKPARFTRAEVLSNAARVYRPGGRTVR